MNGAPNTSIILPGPCQANCEFCYWVQTPAPDGYLGRLAKAVRALPAACRRVTITGGEPTLSPHLRDAIHVLRTARGWDAVVLSTNGARMERLEGLAIDHVNLSRHHHHWRHNEEIFGGPVPDNHDAERIAAELNRRGIDVTWSCVLCDQFGALEQVLAFVEAARRCGASAVTFRADHRHATTERPRELEWTAKRWAVSAGWSCEACRVWRQTIHGMPVYWKASVPEPSVTHGYDYEYVIHPDGRLTADWAGNLDRTGMERWEPEMNRATVVHTPEDWKPSTSDLEAMAAPKHPDGMTQRCGRGRCGR